MVPIAKNQVFTATIGTIDLLFLPTIGTIEILVSATIGTIEILVSATIGTIELLGYSYDWDNRITGFSHDWDNRNTVWPTDLFARGRKNLAGTNPNLDRKRSPWTGEREDLHLSTWIKTDRVPLAGNNGRQA